MKKIILASACILALSAGGAFAQTQPAPGASSEGNVGPGATKGMKKETKGMKKEMTTGTSTRSTRKMAPGDTSSEGNVGPGTSNNAGKQPGGR